MSDLHRGRVVPIAAPLGTEVRRWRVPFTRKRLRLLHRDGEWLVLWHVVLAEMRAYPTREMAEDVCERLMAADGDTWREMPPGSPWWA